MIYLRFIFNPLNLIPWISSVFISILWDPLMHSSAFNASLNVALSFIKTKFKSILFRQGGEYGDLLNENDDRSLKGYVCKKLHTIFSANLPWEVCCILWKRCLIIHLFVYLFTSIHILSSFIDYSKFLFYLKAYLI